MKKCFQFFWKKILTDNREDLVTIGIPEEYLNPARIKQNYLRVDQTDLNIQFTSSQFLFWKNSIDSTK